MRRLSPMRRAPLVGASSSSRITGSRAALATPCWRPLRIAASAICATATSRCAGCPVRASPPRCSTMPASAPCTSSARSKRSSGSHVKRVSAVLAGLLIGTAGALLPIGSAAPVAAPLARPVASEAPATVVAKTCDQAIPVTLPNTDMETVSFDRSPDGTVFVLGARVYHRMGPNVPDEQRVLMLSLSNLEPTDLAAGTDPRFSGSGSRIAYRAPRPEANARATELIVFDVAAKRELARIEDVSATPFGWRGEELLFWRGNELRVWADDRESRVIDAPRTLAGVYVEVRYSGDGERAVMSFYDQRPGRESAPTEIYVVDTRGATSRALIGAWGAVAPRGWSCSAAASIPVPRSRRSLSITASPASSPGQRGAMDPHPPGGSSSRSGISRPLDSIRSRSDGRRPSIRRSPAIGRRVRAASCCASSFRTPSGIGPTPAASESRTPGA